MDWRDAVNAMYEAGGSVATAANIYVLLRDRIVRGTHWGPTLYFFSWGVWNLYYYNHLGQTFSTMASVLLVIANAIWLLIAWKLGAFRKQ